jgi:mannose-6-phosphate isomerase-like protein (cupin superfamily)
MTEENNFKDLTENYLSLDKTGEIRRLAGGDEFWSLPGEEIEKFGKDWLITEFSFNEDWKSWEMHPNGEEIVYMLSGAMDLILEKDGERQTFELRSKGLVIVPRGAWHTAKVFEPSNVLVITRGEETGIRAID